MEIKAIETTYNGYRFRSRLEARWAIFFDTLMIPWEYEWEGYRMPNGDLYLPDFWLPREEVFAEVKAKKLTKYELYLCGNLPNKCLLLVGIPDFKAYKLVPENTMVLIGRGDSNDAPDWSGFWYSPGSINKNSGEFRPGYDIAVNAARSARFEHGEKP